MLVKISLENFEGKLEKFSDIGDVAGVIAVRKSKQFLEITIHRTRNAHGYHIVGVTYDTGLVGLINGNSISIKVLDYKGFPLYV